jgi:hypothetical protein
LTCHGARRFTTTSTGLTHYYENHNPGHTFIKNEYKATVWDNNGFDVPDDSCHLPSDVTIDGYETTDNIFITKTQDCVPDSSVKTDSLPDDDNRDSCDETACNKDSKNDEDTLHKGSDQCLICPHCLLIHDEDSCYVKTTLVRL